MQKDVLESLRRATAEENIISRERLEQSVRRIHMKFNNAELSF